MGEPMRELERRLVAYTRDMEGVTRNGDIEIAHGEADEIAIKVIEMLGRFAGLRALTDTFLETYGRVPKYYA